MLYMKILLLFCVESYCFYIPENFNEKCGGGKLRICFFEMDFIVGCQIIMTKVSTKSELLKVSHELKHLVWRPRVSKCPERFPCLIIEFICTLYITLPFSRQGLNNYPES